MKQRIIWLVLLALAIPISVVAADYTLEVHGCNGCSAVLIPLSASATPSPIATPSPVAGVVRANDFLNSMGVGTKTIQGDPMMANANAVGYLFSGHKGSWIRDDATHDPTLTAALCQIHSLTGVTVDELPVVDSSGSNLTDTKAEWDALQACGALGHLEGPNEPNNFGFTSDQGHRCDGSTYVGCADYMPQLHKLAASYNLLLWGMSEPGAEQENDGLQFLTVPTGAGTLNDGAVFADVATAHNYFQTNTILCNPIDNQVRDAETIAPNPSGNDLMGEYWGSTWAKHFSGGTTGQNDYPKVTTETGWNAYKCTPATSRDQQGKMTVSVYLDAYQLGWLDTAVYELYERGNCDAGYGFFNTGAGADGCAVAFAPALSASYDPSVMAQYALPAANYVHNLTTILVDDSSSFTPVPLTYSISNMPDIGYSMLLEKSDGTYELVIWGEAFRSQTVSSITVNLPQPYNIKVYDVTAGVTATQTLTNVAVVPLTLSDHPLVLEFK